MGPLRCKKSPNPPAQKSARRWGVTWRPCVEKRVKVRSHLMPRYTSYQPSRFKSSRPRAADLLWLLASQCRDTRHATAAAWSRRCGENCKEAREEAPRPVGDSASCLNFLHLRNSVCSLKCIHLRQRALSSSLSQYNAAHPASERYGAADHTGYSHAALTGDSNDQAAMSVPKRVKNLSKNLT